MATVSLVFNLLGLVTAIAGILTAFEITPAFFVSDGLIGGALLTAVFWWAVSVILILSAIAFGVYQTEDKQVVRYNVELPPED